MYCQGCLMKNVFVLSHCILNTASKVSCDESKLQEESLLRRKFLGMAIEQDIQLLQLPVLNSFCMVPGDGGMSNPSSITPFSGKPAENCLNLSGCS